MNNESPFSLFASDLKNIAMDIRPPECLIKDIQDKLVLFLNHVLIQEPLATERMKRHGNACVHLKWRHLTWCLKFTPAGLLNTVDPAITPDLRIELADESPLAVLEKIVQGQKPSIQIAGDVMLAAEVNWLIDHVRWDVEEDLSRLFGDAVAHQIFSTSQRIVVALRQFVSSRFTKNAAGASL
jgi:ubiquinone biosynthesis protein UbiJ